MKFKVGDRVVLLRHWADVPSPHEWGTAGDTGVVVDVFGCTVKVKLDHNGKSWWQVAEYVALIVDTSPHTPADLAMALELADLIESEVCEITEPCSLRCAACVSIWLRAQVIAALRGDQ